jgi:hypothetical protein
VKKIILKKKPAEASETSKLLAQYESVELTLSALREEQSAVFEAHDALLAQREELVANIKRSLTLKAEATGPKTYYKETGQFFGVKVVHKQRSPYIGEPHKLPINVMFTPGVITGVNMDKLRAEFNPIFWEHLVVSDEWMTPAIGVERLKRT